MNEQPNKRFKEKQRGGNACVTTGGGTKQGVGWGGGGAKHRCGGKLGVCICVGYSIVDGHNNKGRAIGINHKG